MLVPATEIAAWRGSDEFVEAFAKGLAVIGAFEDARGMTLADLASATGLPRAGVRRLVHTLVALGLADQRDGRFALTARVMRLGFAYLSKLGLRDVAVPLIEALARESDEVVAVSVLEGEDIVYVARAEPHSVLRARLTVGSRLPAFCTSMGRVLLSGLSEPALEQWLARAKRPAHTRHTLTDAAALRADIAKVRRAGFALVSEEFELGACGIAAAVRDAGGHIVGAVNLSTNLARMSENELVRRYKAPLLDLAAQMSARLPPG